MTARDPRKDPKPKDVVTKPRKQRMVLVRGETWVTYATVPKNTPHLGHGHFGFTTLKEWRKWSKNAKVLHAAD
jgi:hypothetical protein